MTQTRAAGISPAPDEMRGFHHTVNARHSKRLPFSRTARISFWRHRCWSARNRMGAAGRRRMSKERSESDDRQALAAFRATRFDDFATAPGRHPGAIADLAGAFFAVRAE